MKPQFESHTSKPLETVYADNWPRKISSISSVPMRSAKKRLWTSGNELKTSRDDAESAAQHHPTSHASSHDGYFPRSIVELQSGIDRQSYDAVHRIRQRKSSALPRHTMPTKPPPKPKDAHDHDPGPQHPPNMHSGSRGVMPSIQSFRSSTSATGWGFNGGNPFAVFAAFCAGSNVNNNNGISSWFASPKEKPVDAGECRIPDCSSSSENGPHRSEKQRRSPEVAEPRSPSMPGESSRPSKTKSYLGTSSTSRRDPRRSAIYQPSPEVKYPSKCRSETMPRDRIRPGNPLPLKSSKVDNNDSSSESDCDHPSPRPTPFHGKTTFGISQDRAYVVDPEKFQSRPKTSRGTSERLSTGSREGSTRSPPVARAMASAFSSNERPPDLGQHESARVAPLKTRAFDHGGEPRGKHKPYDKPKRISGRTLRIMKQPFRQMFFLHTSRAHRSATMAAHQNTRLISVDIGKGAHHQTRSMT